MPEGVNLPFEITGQIVVVEQNAVLQSLVPALDLSLSLVPLPAVDAPD
jgi:hypothetical protein